MLTIPPAIWEQIEADVLRLMGLAYARGLARGTDYVPPPDPDPTVTFLLAEIERRHAEQQAAFRAYGLDTDPDPPVWLSRLWRPEVPHDDS